MIMNIATLVELAKIAPYLVLPILFFYILWKVSNQHNTFAQQIIKEKSEQIHSISQGITKLSETYIDRIEGLEERIHNKIDLHNAGVESKISTHTEKIDNRVETLNEKIDSLRLDLAKKEL